jgi:GTP1/Obg family GTP-binding protein
LSNMKVRKLIDEADKAQEAKAKIKVDAAVVEAIDLLQTRLADELEHLRREAFGEIQQLRKEVAEVLTRLRQQIEQLRISVEILKRERGN